MVYLGSVRFQSYRTGVDSVKAIPEPFSASGDVGLAAEKHHVTARVTSER